MISPKYRELEQEKLNDDEKYLRKNVKSGSKKKEVFTQKRLFILLMSLVFIFWLFINFSTIDENSAAVQACVGNKCLEDICNEMSNNMISGNLCMDLCVQKTINLPDCGEDKLCPNPYYSFYSAKGYESTLICASKNKDVKLLRQDIEISDFYRQLNKKIEERIHHPPTVEATMNSLIKIADVNFDQKISLMEANNLWQLVNNKHTFYMIALAGRSYMPEIKSFCGGFVEVEQILNQIYLKKESYLESVLPINFNWFWPDWDYRCKISLGILEFFTDAVSFNPNDEFGSDSLYLCSPIELSFGSTFINEAKVTNYNQILNGRELQEKLANVVCQTDADCVYTKQCHTACNPNTNRCTSDLVKPQIVYYCEFLREYLLDNATATVKLEPIINKCVNLTSLTKSNRIMYQKNEMPLSYNKHKTYIEQVNYWNNSMDYAMVTNKLQSTLWEFIKFTKDPQKKKKKKTTPLLDHPFVRPTPL